MRLTPTVTLALALAAGVAGTAAAQGTASPSGTQPQTDGGYQSSLPQTPSTYSQTQPNAGNMSSYSQAQPSTGMAQQPSQMQANTGMPQGNNAPGMNTRQSPNMPETAQAQPGWEQSTMAAQERLKAAGLYNGPVDGRMDPDTRAAIARFQEQNGLRRTERLDTATAARLNSSNQGNYSGSSGAAPSAPYPSQPPSQQTTYGAGSSGPTARPAQPR